MLENEMKEKIKNREAGIEKAKKIKTNLKIQRFFFTFYNILTSSYYLHLF